jgi:hypothetical protein
MWDDFGGDAVGLVLLVFGCGGFDEGELVHH